MSKRIDLDPKALETSEALAQLIVELGSHALKRTVEVLSALPSQEGQAAAGGQGDEATQIRNAEELLLKEGERLGPDEIRRLLQQAGYAEPVIDQVAAKAMTVMKKVKAAER
jgi:hypothetical protein